MISDQSLQDWKLPPSSSSDIYEQSGSFSCFPDCRVKTVEKQVQLPKGFSTYPLFSKRRQRSNLICYNYLHVGMIEVALKPIILGSNISAIICLHDYRIRKIKDSVLGRVESSLCDGPIYFSYFPNYSVPLSDAKDTFRISVQTKGSNVMRRQENITLMYRFHYRVTKQIYIYGLPSCYRVDNRGETTFFCTDIAQSNRVVSKKFCWDQIGVNDEGSSMVENELHSSPTVGGANVDWKETVDAHVLKVDVPGFKKEEVRVEVEDGRILEISGERSKEEDGESDQKWHCEERSNGKFSRRLKLPEDANLNQLKAAIANGVLTVTVPKEEVDKNPQVKKVVIDISAFA